VVKPVKVFKINFK